MALAVVGTVLIVNAGGGGGQNNTVPTANEVALQAPQDPGPAPFTQSVETQAVQAPAPASTSAGPAATQTGGATATQTGGATGAATATAAIHRVEGTSAGVYGGTMSKPSCDVERLVSITATGDTGRAWASAQGIEQSKLPGYLRSLTSAYLRVDTRVTNHGYQGGTAVAYQAVLQAGTAVLVDTQGVPRARCGCGNPLKEPALVAGAKYTGKAWAGFQPSTLVILAPAAQPVAEIVLVDVTTGGWFTRVTGQAQVVDQPAQPPSGPLVPGVPAAAVWKTFSPTAPGATSASTSASASGSTTGGTTTSGSPSGPTSGSASASSGSATATTPGATTSGATTPGITTTATTPPPTTATATATPTTTAPPTTAPPTTTAPIAPTATATATTAKPTVTATSTPAATATTAKTATVTATATATATTATTTSVEEPETATGTTG
ncbi:hypothetical protein GCM10009639_07830 [Kitasatospora putterlickiae]|uniref:DUF6777 domain-containing protein n=1 Tax=Kitasatospora putterlickiae TaxID=221725 RepID=A0ABN1XM68_9ACTN